MADYTTSANLRSTEMLSGGAIPQPDSAPIADNVFIPVGTMVGIDSSGNATPVSANWIGRPRGIAIATYDNTGVGHAAGAFKVEFHRGVASLDMAGSTDALTAADKGRRCYVVDNHTVARTSSSGDRAIAGTFEGLDDDGTSALVRVGVAGVDDAPAVDIELVAAADLSSSQNLFIKVDSNGKAALAGAGDPAIGVLMNAPGTGAIAIVRVAGIARVIAGGAVTKGAFVASDSAAKAKAAVTAVTDTTSGSDSATTALKGSNVAGIALETGVASSLMSIFLTLSGAVPTTAQ